MKKLDLKELTELDIVNLIQACERSDWNGAESRQVLHEALTGGVTIWRVDGEEQGIAVTKVLEYSVGRELALLFYYPDVLGESLVGELTELAKASDCKYIGVVLGEQDHETPAELGFSPKTQHCVKEV